MATAIKGSSGDGTVAADILKKHQADVYNAMADGSKITFLVLQTQLVTALGLSQAASADDSSPRVGDAIHSSKSIAAAVTSLDQKLDAALPASDAASIKTAVSSLFTIVGESADAELQIGIVEQAMNGGGQKYAVDSEIALSDSERKTYAAFLAKDHFTKADFAALDQFYKTAYDRLSERGRDEMTHRIFEGMRH